MGLDDSTSKIDAFSGRRGAGNEFSNHMKALLESIARERCSEQTSSREPLLALKEVLASAMR